MRAAQPAWRPVRLLAVALVVVCATGPALVGAGSIRSSDVVQQPATAGLQQRHLLHGGVVHPADPAVCPSLRRDARASSSDQSIDRPRGAVQRCYRLLARSSLRLRCSGAPRFGVPVSAGTISQDACWYLSLAPAASASPFRARVHCKTCKVIATVLRELPASCPQHRRGPAAHSLTR